MSPPHEVSSLSMISVGELDPSSSCHLGNGSMKEEDITLMAIDPNPTAKHSKIPKINFANLDSDLETEPHTGAYSQCSILDLFGAKTEEKAESVDDIFSTDFERKRIDEEINTSLRSLKTNFLLTSAYFFTFLGVFLLPNYIYVVAVSVVKGMLPLLTSITNFGKIQNLFDKYMADFNQKFQNLNIF